MDQRAGCLRVVMGAALIALAGCDEPNQFQPPPPPNVIVQTPTVQDETTYTEYTGRIVAFEEVDIRARVAGFLESVEFTEGQVVEKDQILFRIEADPYEAALAAANADLAQNQAALGLAATTLQKLQRAAERGAATEIEVIEAEAKLDAAEAAVLGSEASIRNAEINLSYTEVRSPIRGRASRRFVSVGNLVGSGESTLLTTVVLDDPIYLYFEIGERDVLMFLRDTPRGERTSEESEDAVVCDLVLADGSRYPHQGRINFANNIVDAATGTITVRAVFENPEGKLFPGLFGRALIPQLSPDALVIPELAIQRDLVGSYVLIVDESGTVIRRDVTPGARVDEGLRIIDEGLEGNEQVIVQGLQRARPGATVNPTFEDSSSGQESSNAMETSDAPETED